MATEYERCAVCDEPTGCAGRGDDSLYIGDRGPFSQDCYDVALDADAGEGVGDAR